MMHVMSAPPAAPAAGTPAAGRAKRSSSSGNEADFASILAAQSGPATGEQPQASGEPLPALPSVPADQGETSGEPAEPSGEGPSVLLAVVAAPTPVTVEGASPAAADLPSKDEGAATGPPVESVESADRATGTSSTTTATTTTLGTAATASTASASTGTAAVATEAASPAAPVPPPAAPTSDTTSTTADQTRPTAEAPAAPTDEGGLADPTGVAPDTSDTIRSTHTSDGRARPDQAAVSETARRAAPESAQPGAGPTTRSTEKVDVAARRPSTVDRPGPRVAPQGQADMSAAASVTSDADGAAPVASRPAAGSQPLPSTVMDRVMRAVEALENAPPPKRVSFEVDGLRMTVSLRGDEINVAVRGGGDQLGAGWQRDLDGALRGRGLGLADGHGSDTDRGDGRRHPDDRPPHGSAGRGPAFRQPAEPDGDASTSLHL